jgi:hypothetical protein
MLRTYYWAVVCLLSTLALGQSPAHSAAEKQFHGIKVIAAKFNPEASPQAVSLDFINDSATNITAWGYCVYADKLKGADPNQGFCVLNDAVGFEVDRHIQEEITLQSNPADCPSCHFVRPGEHKVLSALFGVSVAGASIQMKLIAYADGRVETSSDDEGADDLRQLMRGRQMQLSRSQELVQIGNKLLSDVKDSQVAQKMISELETRSQAEPWLESSLHQFKTPDWRRANSKEFVPKDERGYLANFVNEAQMQANEFSKYLIKEVH